MPSVSLLVASLKTSAPQPDRMIYILWGWFEAKHFFTQNMHTITKYKSSEKQRSGKKHATQN